MKSSIKTVLIALCITMFATLGNATANNSNLTYNISGYENQSVNDAAIINYMSEHGYTVISVYAITGSTNYIVKVTGGKCFMVYTNGSNILGHEEIYIG